MKSLKRLLVIAAVIFMAPMLVCADDMPEANRDKVNLYIFRGEGCPHCEEALEFINGLDEEYKSYFNLVQYEVWYDETNSKNKKKVSNYFKDNATGVPYIIVGDYRLTGFMASDGDSLKEAIKSAYYNDSYVDYVEEALNAKESNDIVFIIVLALVIVGGVVFVLFMSRDEKDDQEEVKVKESKEVKEIKKSETGKSKTKKNTKKNTKKK